MISETSRRILEQFHLPSAQLGHIIGERLVPEAGQSVEFHDFRPYQAGDALRYVDWKVYRRTGRKYTRLFQAERALDVHIVLDDSASMRLGGKLRYAKILAAMLIYLARGNSSHVHSFSQRYLVKGQTLKHLWQGVDALAAESQHSSSQAICQLVQHLPSHGAQPLLLLISDFFDETSLQTALQALKWRRMGAVFLQIVAQEDITPVKEMLELSDIEWGGKLEVTPAQVRAYQAHVASFLQACQQHIQQAGFAYQRFVVDEAITELAILEQLRHSTWLKR